MRVFVTALMTAAVVAGGVPATAHAPAPDADTVLAQTIAGMEVTLAVRRPGQVPGPLRVDLIPHTPVRAIPIRVTVRSHTSATVASDSVRFDRDTPRTYPLLLSVREKGPHWLELRADGEFSQLPFQVKLPRAAPSELWVSWAFGAAAVLMFTAFGVAALNSRAIAVALGSAAGVALVVGVTLAAVSPRMVPATTPLTAATDPVGRPYAQSKIVLSDPHPAAGETFTLRILLVDGATGRPLDDLVPHHQALAHLLVTSADGATFRHLHPRRTASGQMEARLAAPEPGAYLVSVEFERNDAGSQLVSGRFEVAGQPTPVRMTAPARPVRLAPGTLNDEFDVRRAHQLVAGSLAPLQGTLRSFEWRHVELGGPLGGALLFLGALGGQPLLFGLAVRAASGSPAVRAVLVREPAGEWLGGRRVGRTGHA